MWHKCRNDSHSSCPVQKTSSLAAILDNMLDFCVLIDSCLLKDGMSSVVKQPDGGHSFSDPQIVQVRQESDGIEGQKLLCQSPECLEIVHNLHAI